ncbi:MAG: hypothetical protein LC667_18820 [Thioalkalivibrio sp.]|nr:hypothetical protein [Thioalkalivibrio sp.]
MTPGRMSEFVDFLLEEAPPEPPEGFVPMFVGDGLVWGTYREGLDIESVRAYWIDH